ncbi:hypothetical protein XENTR_v10024686 [Xenopus tropicalis]|nr:hypothetical protein XENTR_v10024686 [Xenopus tropicalis]
MQAYKKKHLPNVSSNSDSERLLYLGSPDESKPEGTDRDYQPEEATGESDGLPPPSSGPSSGKRKGQERLRSLKFNTFENDALIETLVPVYEKVIGRYAAKTPTAFKAKAWKDIAEAVNSVGVCLRNVQNCKKRYQDIKRVLRKKMAEDSRYRSGTGGGPAKRVHYTHYEEQLLPLIQRERVRGVSGIFDTDRNVGQDSSPPGPSRRRQTASAPVPGGHSSSRLHSPRRDPEFEGEGFSGEESERGSHVGGSDVALFSDEEPANVPQQQQLPTQAPTPGLQAQAQDRFHKTLIKHHKILMRKLNFFHSDLCVATQAYNEAQARQAAHESAMRRHEAAMLSLEEEKVKLKRQKVALLAEQNALLREQVAALKQQGQKPTEPTSSTSSTTAAPPPPGSTRQLRKRK